MILEFLDLKKQGYLRDSRDMYLWCGGAVYHGLQSWSLVSQENGLNDCCSVSWSCSSCTLSDLTGTTQICPDVKTFPIAKITKWKNTSYSTFCWFKCWHLSGMHSNINFSSVFGVRIVLATTEKEVHRVVQRFKIYQNILPMVNSLACSIIRIQSFIPFFSSQKPRQIRHEALPSISTLHLIFIQGAWIRWVSRQKFGM